MAIAMKRNNNIYLISYTDTLKIHLFSFFWGFFNVIKKFLRQAIYSANPLLKRDSPPTCLIDTSLGQHSYIKLKRVKLHFVEAGEKHLPVLLLLHGFPDCWISWRYQISTLAEHYRVIALDLKGFGDSDKPEPRKCYRVDILLEEIRELIEVLGVVNCSIVGHDLGALLGWFMIHLYPDLVMKFVAISCPHPNLYWTSLPKNSSFNTSWIHYSQLPHLPELDALRDDLKIINKCYQHLNTKEISKSYMDAYKYTFSRKEDWTGPINYFRNLPFWRVNVAEGECVMNIPTLLVVGNQDPEVQLESVVKSTDYLEKFQMKVIEGSGHFPHQENPDEVNKALLNFLVGTWVHKKQAPKPKPGFVYRVFGAVTSTLNYRSQELYNNEASTKSKYIKQNTT